MISNVSVAFADEECINASIDDMGVESPQIGGVPNGTEIVDSTESTVEEVYSSEETEDTKLSNPVAEIPEDEIVDYNEIPDDEKVTEFNGIPCTNIDTDHLRTGDLTYEEWKELMKYSSDQEEAQISTCSNSCFYTETKQSFWSNGYSSGSQSSTITQSCVFGTGNGQIYSEWVKDGTGWFIRVQFSDGHWGCPIAQWVKVGDNWYYFDSRGYMLENQFAFAPLHSGSTVQNGTYCGFFYLGNNGVMNTGWQYINNRWYYFQVTIDTSKTAADGEAIYRGYSNAIWSDDTSLSAYGKTVKYCTGVRINITDYVQRADGGYDAISRTADAYLNGGSQATATATATSYSNTHGRSGTNGNVSLTMRLNTNDSDQNVFSGSRSATYYYDRNTGTVRYNGNGATGGSTANQGLRHGASVAASGCGFSKTGYTFRGWNTSSNGTGTWLQPGNTITNSWGNGAVLTLYAQWSINSYTMTSNHYKYDVNSNKWVLWTTTTASSKYNSTYVPAYATPPTGYHAYSRDWNDGWTVSGNGTFSVYYYPNSYTVTFNGIGANGGSVASMSCLYDVAYSLNGNAFSKQGYNYVNWNTSPNGGGTAYSNGASIKNLTSVNGAGIGLYAQWTPWKHTVSYDANGGSNVPMGQTKTYDQKMYVPSSRPVRSGYSFNSWNTNKNGSGTKYTSGSEYKYDQNGGSRTLYAQWDRNTYKLTVDVNNGTGTSGDFLMLYGDTKNLGTPTKQGYIFSGWKIVSDNSAESSLSNGVFKMGYNRAYSTESYTADTSVKVQAQWTPWRHTVNYNANGGKNAPSSMVKVYDTKLNVSSNSPVRTGYTFIGWSTDKDGNGKFYKAGQDYDYDQNGGSVTLYAQWTFNPITVTVPKVLIADANGHCSFFIKADNEIGTLTVSIPNGIGLSQRGKNQVLNGNAVLQSNTITPSNHEIKGTVDVGKLSAGTWQGSMTIQLNYQE